MPETDVVAAADVSPKYLATLFAIIVEAELLRAVLEFLSVKIIAHKITVFRDYFN